MDPAQTPPPHDSQQMLHYYTPADAGPGRPVGLIVWGVIFCIIAGVSGCVAAVMPLMLMAPTPGRLPLTTMILAVLIYLAVAAGMAAIGVACFQGRRWVGKVVPALGWPLAAMGLVAVPVSAIGMATLEMPQPMAPGVVAGMVIGTVVVGIAVSVLLPALAAWYFGRSQLRQALVLLDVHANWTDGRSTATVALVLWMALAGFMLMISAPIGVAFLFGIILTGPAAIALLAVEGLVLLVGAWLAWQRNIAGWWIAVAMTLFFYGSTAVTVLLQGAEAVAIAPLTEEQQQLMMGSIMLTTPVQLTLTLFYATAIVAVLLWIRSRISVADTGPTGEQLVAEDEEVKLW